MSVVPSGIGVIGGDFLSAPRLNRMLVHILKGVEMPTYSPKYDGMHVWCSEDGSGFVRGTAYIWDGLLGQYRGSSGGRHKHDSDTEAAGGLFVDILRANMGKYFEPDLIAPTLGSFNIVKSGTGTESYEAATNRNRFNTGSTSASTINGKVGGVALDLSKPIEMGFKGYVDANTFISTRLGVAMEPVADSISDASKFGLEGCDSAGTAKNWDVVTATGALSSRTIQTSSETLLRAAPKFYKLIFTPGQSVTFAIDGSVPLVTKLSNIPAGGRTSGLNNFTAGIKTNNSSAKSMYVYAARVIGTINDLQWFS